MWLRLVSSTLPSWLDLSEEEGAEREREEDERDEMPAFPLFGDWSISSQPAVFARLSARRLTATTEAEKKKRENMKSTDNRKMMIMNRNE